MGSIVIEILTKDDLESESLFRFSHTSTYYNKANIFCSYQVTCKRTIMSDSEVLYSLSESVVSSTLELPTVVRVGAVPEVEHTSGS